jgi:type II secretory pathway pseudopilin PulG
MTKRQGQSGFALLLVLAMTAVVAIMLYMEVPRVAFEAQRDKEQLLIDRGEQYSRAIQLYVRKFNRYPPDFAALENTQNLRFLRRRYTDPMNPKKADSDSDVWRIVHVGAGGVFTDSLVYNVKKDGAAGSTPEKQTFITEMQQVGGNPTDPNQGPVSIADRRRQSDQPGAPGDPNNPNSAFPQVPGSNPTLNNTGQNNLPGGYQPPPGVQFPGGVGGMQPGLGGPLPGQMPPGVQLPPGVQIPGVNARKRAGRSNRRGASVCRRQHD